MNNHEKVAELFKVFGDATRIQILSVLMDGELSAGQISEKLSMSASAVSHQLAMLRSSRLVRGRRDGRSVLYSLNDEHVEKIISCGMEHILEEK